MRIVISIEGQRFRATLDDSDAAERIAQMGGNVTVTVDTIR